MASPFSPRAHDRWAMYQRGPGGGRGGRSGHSSRRTSQPSGRLPSLAGRHGATSAADGGAFRQHDRSQIAQPSSQIEVPASLSRSQSNRSVGIDDADFAFDIRSYVSPVRAPPPVHRALRSTSNKQMVKTVEEEEEPQSISLPEIPAREVSLPPLRVTPAVFTESVHNSRTTEEDERGPELEAYESDEEICEETESPPPSPIPPRKDSKNEEQSNSATEKPPHVLKRKVTVLEFPSCPGSFGLFPVTIMQEHCLIDTQLLQAQLRSQGYGELHGTSDLSLAVDNIVRSYTIQGPLNTVLLEQALSSVIRNHPLLRVVFYQYRDNFYGRAAEEIPVFTLENAVSGGGIDPVSEERRRPFRLQVYPIDRDELVKEGLLSDEDLMLEDENGVVGYRQSQAHLPGVAEETDLTRVNITGLDDIQVKSSTRARRIGSALKRRPTTSFLSHQRVQSIENIPEKSCLGASKAHSLLSAAEGKPPNVCTSINNLAASQRSLSSSHNTIPDENMLAPVASLWMRGKVVRQLHSPTAHQLILTFPQFIADFWSASMFVISVAKEYTRLEKEQVHNTPLARSQSRQGRRQGRRASNRLDQVLSLTSGPPGRPLSQSQGGNVAAFYAKQQELKMKQKFNSVDEHELADSVSAAPVSFQQVALRENSQLQKVSRAKLWTLWIAQASLTVLNRQGEKRTKPAPPLRLPGHVRSEAARRTSVLRSARLRPGTFSLNGSKTVFKFLKLCDEITEDYQQNLPQDCWKCLPPDEPLYLFTLGLFVVVMAHCCRGWDGVGKHQNTSLLATNHLGVERAGTGSWVSSVGVSSTRALDRPTTVRVRQSARQGTAPPGAGYFIVGVQLSLRDLSPPQLLPVFGPLTNDGCLKVALPLCQTFTDLLLALHKQLKSLRRQLHFPFSSVTEEVGLPGGLPICFSFLRRRDIRCLTDPEAFYFTETAVGVPGDGLARFGMNCYLQPDNGQMRDGCRLELLLWEMLENESVRGGFRFQPQYIKPSLVDGLVEEFCSAATVVAQNPSISLQELVSMLRPPFNHHKMRPDRKLSAHSQW